MVKVKKREKRFGQIAIEKRFITKEQLIEAITCQVKREVGGSGHQHLGSLLQELDYMDEDEVKEVLDVMGILVGKRKEKPPKKETKQSIPTRDFEDRRIGVIAVKSKWITAKQLVEALDRQIDENLAGKPHRLIGSILFDLGYISTSQIKKALRALDDDPSEPQK